MSYSTRTESTEATENALHRAAAVALCKTPLSDREKQMCLQYHGVAPYVPLKTLSQQFGDVTPEQVPNVISSFINPPNTYRNYCMACLETVQDDYHIYSPQHRQAVSAQLFRLNVTDERRLIYTEWLGKHAMGREHKLAKDMKVRLTYLPSNVIGGHAAMRFNSLADLGNQFSILYVESNLGRQRLCFRLEYSHPKANTAELVAIVSCTQPMGPHVQESIPLAAEIRFVDIPVEFEADTPGIQYYSLQIWIKSAMAGQPPRYFPICGVIRWLWHPRQLERSIEQWLKQTAQINPQDTTGVSLSKIPNSNHNPPRTETQPEGGLVERCCKPKPFTHSDFTEYHEGWDARPETNATHRAKHRKIVTGDMPQTSLACLGIRGLLDLITPITKHNIIERCLAEILGQAQYEEDTPMKATVKEMRWAKPRELELITNINACAQENDAVFISVELPTGDYKGVKSQILSKTVRLVHPEWQAKYLADIVFEAANPHTNTTQVLLMMNAGVKRQLSAYFANPGCSNSADNAPIIIPLTSLITVHILGLYHTLLYDSPQDDALQPAATATANDESSSVNDNEVAAKRQRVIQRIPADYRRWPLGNAGFVADRMDIDGGTDSDAESYVTIDTYHSEDSVELRMSVDDDLTDAASETEQERPLSNRLLHQKSMRDKIGTAVNFLFATEMPRASENNKLQLARPLPASWAACLDQLDQRQQLFMDCITRGERLTCCMAPPGTGKTHIIAMAAVLQYCAFEVDNYALCVVPTNAAANVLARKIIEMFKQINGEVPKGGLLRYVRDGYPASELGDLYAYSNLRVDEASNTTEGYMSLSQVMQHGIVVTTVDMAIMNIVNSNKFLTSAGETYYRLVIADEAASIDLPKLMLLMILAADGQMVLVGDVKQLPAYVTSGKVKAVAGDESGMEFVMRVLELQNPYSVIILHNNYRSTTSIISPSNRIIYNDDPLVAVNHAKLINATNALPPQTQYYLGSYLFPGAKSGYSFVHVEGINQKHGSSYYNACEFFMVHEVLKRFQEVGIDLSTVGVDSTYKAQSTLLNRMAAEAFPDTSKKCTNSWQGEERDYMIISLVRSDGYYDTFGEPCGAGFLEDVRRLNVSLTRARKGNIIICNALRFVHHPLIGEALRLCCTYNSWISDPLLDVTTDFTQRPHHMANAVKHFIHLIVCEGYRVGNIGSDLPTIVESLQKPLDYCSDHYL